MQKQTDEMSLTTNKSSYPSLMWEFFKIGIFTIGGGIVMIPQIQHTAVDEKKWLTENEMLDCIAIGQSLPGIIAVNLATFVGYKQRGVKGAVVATLGITLPAFIAVLAALVLLEYIGDNRFVEGAFMGVKAAVCGLIVVTAIRLIRQMTVSRDSYGAIVRNVFTALMAVGAFLAVGFFGVTAILVIVVGITAGILLHCLFISKEADK